MSPSTESRAAVEEVSGPERIGLTGEASSGEEAQLAQTIEMFEIIT